ncbi:RING finger protein 126 [Tupaia chinensis]|uniref:E3 ubiquitin-protein ligase RNF115 n=1 Tax=Tupaia chinensis TaxID=246437 RepID=L8XZ19_TUPCH|nr:RING finger protein 126 [Tupaia chinensis]
MSTGGRVEDAASGGLGGVHDRGKPQETGLARDHDAPAEVAPLASNLNVAKLSVPLKAWPDQQQGDIQVPQLGSACLRPPACSGSLDYICPRCESGFIEELPAETRHTEDPTPSTAPTDQGRQPLENVDQPLLTLPQGYGQFAFGIFDDSFEIPTFPPGAQADDSRDPESRREREHPSRHRYGARQPRARLPGSACMRGCPDHPLCRRIIQQLVNGIITPAAIPSLGLGPWGVLHSNPMDYAWGANGLDAIITQLLNQFENTGPPPADKEKIQALPTVPVTEEHVGSGLECPVCKDDYALGESVRQLPCNHLFHDSCIVPWLEQPAVGSPHHTDFAPFYPKHDSCPVCRKSLTGQNTATNPPGLTGVSFSSSSSSSSSSSPGNENAASNS